MYKETNWDGNIVWNCVDCGQTSKRAQDLAKHIEAKHIDSPGYICDHCEKHCPSKNALTAHISRNHRKTNY